MPTRIWSSVAVKEVVDVHKYAVKTPGREKKEGKIKHQVLTLLLAALPNRLNCSVTDSGITLRNTPAHLSYPLSSSVSPSASR